MDMWKLMVAYLVCDISCCILPWINPSAMVCISKDPYSTDGGVLNILPPRMQNFTKDALI